MPTPSSSPVPPPATPGLTPDNTTPPADDPLRLDDLRVFHNLGRAITSALDRDSILQAIVTQMLVFFPPKTWSLLLTDDARQLLHYAIKEGALSTDSTLGPIPVGQGMAGWVADRGEPLIVPDATALAAGAASVDPAVHIFPGELSGLSFPVQSAINMPLRSRNRTLGVLQVFNCPLETLTDYAMTFLNLLSDYAGIAIENAQILERIQELTITDDATHLFNSRYLHTALQTEFERSRRFHSEFSVIFIDLDHFKNINDRYGHLIGTALLVEVAALVQKTTRSIDSVFRYGGDEFVILLPQTSKPAAIEVAQRLLHTLRDTVFLKTRSLNLKMTASFGISTYPHDGDNPEAVLHAADTIMYSVKRSHRDDIASSQDPGPPATTPGAPSSSS